MSVDERVVLEQIDIALTLIEEARIQLWKDTPEKFKKTRNGQVFFHTLSSTDISRLCTRIYATI